MARNKNKKTTFVSSKSVVSDDFLNSIYGGLKDTEQESLYDSTDPLIGGHVHDGVSADGHAQKIDLSKHVTGQLPASMISGSVGIGAPGLPLNSFQFNSADTFGGASSFLYDSSTDNLQISKDNRLYFGSIDSPNSFYIQNNTHDSYANLKFLAENSADSQFIFSTNYSQSTDVVLRMDGGAQYFFPKGTGRMGIDVAGDKYIWESLKINWIEYYGYVAGSDNKYVRLSAASTQQTYNIQWPKYKPTSDNLILKSTNTTLNGTEFTWDTISSNPGTPLNSFQFNSADTFGGTETFYFEPSTRDVVFAKDHKWWFGSSDSTNSFWIEHEIDGTTPILEFYAKNSTDSDFVFTNGASGTTDVIVKLRNNISYIYPTGTGFLGNKNFGELYKWENLYTNAVELYHNTGTANNYITLNADDVVETYSLQLPKYRPTTVDMLMKVVSYGVSTELTWDNTITVQRVNAQTVDGELFQARDIMTNSLTVNNNYTFTTVDGSANYILRTDGAGNVSWSAENLQTIIAGEGLVKTGNTLDVSGTVSSLTVSNLSIAGNYSLPTVDGLANYILKTDGAGNVSWTVDNTVSGISNIVEDTTPELGGNLNLNGNDILGTGDITINGNMSADLFRGDFEGPIHFQAKAGVALTKGEVVYVSGLDGNTPIVQKARANSSSTMPAFGIAGEDVALNNTGNIVTFGSETGLDSADFGELGVSFSLGDTLYVSASTAGRVTNVAPSGESNFIQNIGKIERVSPSTNMTIKVGGAGRTNATPALNEGNIFIGDSSDNAVTVSLQTQVEAYSINNVVEDATPQLGGTLDANGNVIDMGTNIITDSSVANWNTAYGWGDHSLAGYQDSINAGEGLVKTGNTLDVSGTVSSLNVNTLDVVNLIINSEFTFPTTDGTAGYMLVTDGLGNVVWGEPDQYVSGNNINITSNGTIETQNDILINTLDATYGEITTLSIGGNYTLPTADGSANYILKTDGAGNVSWTVDSGGISNVVEDTTPQLGGELDANGNNINMGVNTITDPKVGQWNTAYGWGDHSLAGYQEIINAGEGLVKTGNTLDVSGTVSSLNVNTLDVVNLTINSEYTLPTTDGSPDYILITDGAGNASWSGDLSPNNLQVNNILKIEDGVHEKTTQKTGATGTVVHDCSTGHIFYHSSIAGNFTPNLTNLNLDEDYSTVVSLMLNQNTTAYDIVGLQIGGASQTIRWEGGVAPSGTVSSFDIVTFSIYRFSALQYIVFGQLMNFDN